MGDMNGHDRVERYRLAANDQVFRALVGDDINGLIKVTETVVERLDSTGSRLNMVMISIIMFLAGVIGDIAVRLIAH